ncbi:MAG: Ig-like domain-containing protein [bacterium]
MKLNRKIFILALFLLTAGTVFAANLPTGSGDFWFRLATQTQTGTDNTGDGGNYYYVGQDVTYNINAFIGSSEPSNAADFILLYDKNKVSASSLTTLSAYQNWIGSNIDNAVGRLTLSGYGNPGVYVSGAKSYATVKMSALKPTGIFGSVPVSTFTIDYTSGSTIDSGIYRDGLDYMNNKEDYKINIWADIKKPYGQTTAIADGANGVTVDSVFPFRLRDSKNGEGDDTGVGTGVNSASAGRVVQMNDGSGATSIISSTNFACSGTWNSLCNATVDPDSPMYPGIGDNRNWKYNTTYTVRIAGFQDRASSNQVVAGINDAETNGPNTMDQKTWTFTTEADTGAPTATAVSPTAGQSSVSNTTSITINVLDKKSASVSGSGVDPTTCSINVSAPSWGPDVVYTSVSPTVTVTDVDYGKRFLITPASPFAQNETVSVNISGCKDLAGNTMTAYPYSFQTSDENPPSVTESPNHGVPLSGGTMHLVLSDDGSGVDENNTVILVNGNYYTKGGGAANISYSGTGIETNISFASSNDFTSFLTSTSSNILIFDIPISSYTTGESVALRIWSKDIAGNIMSDFSDSYSMAGPAVVEGSTFCGSNTTWNGTTQKCNGTASVTNVTTTRSSSGGSIRYATNTVYVSYPVIQYQTLPIYLTKEVTKLVSSGSPATTTNSTTTVVKIDKQIVDRVSTALPNSVLVIIIILSIIIFILLSLNSVAVDKMIFARNELLILSALLAFIALMFFFSSFIGQNNGLNSDNYSNVSGQVLDPINNQAVNGVDLVVGDTSIKTSDGGNFSFDNVNEKIGIKVTSPNLHKTLYFVQNRNSDIFFDANMYNSLFLAFEKVNSNENKANVISQDMKISDVKVITPYFSDKLNERFDKVVEITIDNKGKSETYIANKSGEIWRVFPK